MKLQRRVSLQPLNSKSQDILPKEKSTPRNSEILSSNSQILRNITQKFTNQKFKNQIINRLPKRSFQKLQTIKQKKHFKPRKSRFLQEKTLKWQQANNDSISKKQVKNHIKQKIQKKYIDDEDCIFERFCRLIQSEQKQKKQQEKFEEQEIAKNLTFQDYSPNDFLSLHKSQSAQLTSQTFQINIDSPKSQKQPFRVSRRPKGGRIIRKSLKGKNQFEGLEIIIQQSKSQKFIPQDQLCQKKQAKPILKNDIGCQTDYQTSFSKMFQQQYRLFCQKKKQFYGKYREKFQKFFIICEETQIFIQRNDMITNISRLKSQNPPQNTYNYLGDLSQKLSDKFFDQLMELRNYETKKKQKISQIKQRISEKVFLVKNSLQNHKSGFTATFQDLTKKADELQQFVKNQLNKLCTYIHNTDQNLNRMELTHKEWVYTLKEKQKLLLKCFQQVKKIPEISISLFGIKEEEVISDFENRKLLKHKFEDFLNQKCEHCFNFKQKLRLLNYQNIKSKPVLRLLKVLLKDAGQIRDN